MSKDIETILITGASGHIGQSLVTKYLDQGFCVVGVSHRNPIKPAENFTSIVEDLSQHEAGSRIIKKAIAAYGRIDFIINNAARQDVALIENEKSQSILEIFQVNVSSIALMYAEIAKNGYGVQSIVNISSIEAGNARSGHGVYGASKAALEALTKSAAQELAPMRSNALRLGLIEREGIANAWPAGVAAWEESVPLGRMGTITDVLEATDFLLKAPWITGTVLTLDGGMSAVTNW